MLKYNGWSNKPEDAEPVIQIPVGLLASKEGALSKKMYKFVHKGIKAIVTYGIYVSRYVHICLCMKKVLLERFPSSLAIASYR